MEIAYIILGVVGIVFGSFVRRTSNTMSSGPKEGTRYGGMMVAAIAGAVVGFIISLFGSPITVASVFFGTLWGLGYAWIGFMVPYIVGYAFGRR